MTTSNESVPSNLDLDRLMAELEAGVEELPERALRAAQAHRDLVVPRLIEVLRSATAASRDGNGPSGNAHFFALFLLAEVFDFAKNTGVAYTVGQILYWDDTNNAVTTTATGNKLIGKVVLAAATTDTSVRIRMSQ